MALDPRLVSPRIQPRIQLIPAQLPAARLPAERSTGPGRGSDCTGERPVNLGCGALVCGGPHPRLSYVECVSITSIAQHSRTDHTASASRHQLPIWIRCCLALRVPLPVSIHPPPSTQTIIEGDEWASNRGDYDQKETPVNSFHFK